MARPRGTTGLFAYAGIVSVEMALQLYRRQAIAAMQASHDYDSKLLDVVNYAELALGVASVFAIVDAARLPRSAGARPRFRVAAVVDGVLAAAAVLETLFVSRLLVSWGHESVETWFRVLGFVFAALHVGLAATLGLALVAVGRAAKARAILPFVAVGWAAAAVRVVAVALPYARGGVVPTLYSVSYYGTSLAFAGACVATALAASRLEPDPPRGTGSPYREGEAPDDEAARGLPPSWGEPAAGISLYLAGAGARVLCALLSYSATSGLKADGGFAALRQAHDGVFMVAILSGAASLAMIAGVFRISRAPAEARATAPANLALGAMLIGMLVELYSTSLTLEALGGSVSAAFRAMDALPVLVAVTAVLGVVAVWGLSGAIAALAKRLALEEAERRARGVAPLVSIAVGVVAVAAVAKAPAELLIGVGLIVVPLALFAVVRFVAAALAVSRTIGERLEPGARP